MRRLSGFSLMEMMTVLLIVSVVAAASAPMINKRMMVNQAAGDCVWERLGDGSIYYNQEDGSVIIGADTTNNNLSPKLHIRTNNNNNPFITFQQGANNQLALNYRANTLGLSANNPTDGGTAIGANANANGRNSIAVGRSANALGGGATAVGEKVDANGNSSIAIGNYFTTADKDYSIAIGRRTRALSENSIAIGQDAKANSGKSIAIGQNTESSYHGIAIGNNARAKDAGIAIGSKYNRWSNDDAEEEDDQVYAGNEAIAIGVKARADFDGSIAIGNNAQILYQLHGSADEDHNGIRSIAIGENSKCLKMDSVAIGSNAVASKDNSVAIGTGAETTTSNQIVLGRKSYNYHGIDVPATTVYIPGNLVVDGRVILGRSPGNYAWLRAHRHDSNEEKLFQVRYDGDNVEVSGASYDYAHTNGLSNLYPLSSDRRLKNVGKAFTSGLAEIKKLEVFNYTFKKDESKTPRVGVMAQDLQKIFPNAVTKGEDGFLRIRMEDMFYAVVNAVKELDNKFDLLAQKQKKIDELEAKLDKLEKRLEKLEKQK